MAEARLRLNPAGMTKAAKNFPLFTPASASFAPTTSHPSSRFPLRLSTISDPTSIFSPYSIAGESELATATGRFPVLE